MEKRTKALIIYGVVILIILATILFIIPDSALMKLYEKNIDKINNETKEQEEAKPIEFVDYEIQKERILKNKYEYQYVILDSMGKQTYKYNCSGKTSGKVDSGTCTSPSDISYTEKTKKKSFKIDTKYLDLNYIFTKLLKDKKPDITEYKHSKEYNYKAKIQDLETEIIVYTDPDNITKIEISNAYMTYILKYSNISYWQLFKELVS